MIDFKQILHTLFSNHVENHWWFLLIVMIIGITFLTFLYEPGDRSRENRKVFDISSRLIAFSIIIIFGYLVINQYFLILALLIIGVILYLAYKIGLISL